MIAWKLRPSGAEEDTCINHHGQQTSPISLPNTDAAQWNKQLILKFRLREPEIYLLSIFLKNYSRRIEIAKGLKINKKEESPGNSPPEFRTRLDLAENTTIIHLLSNKITALLAQFSELNIIKCDKNIVAKVITKINDYIEYTSMQYLMDQAPDILTLRIIFMSYISGTTLAENSSALGGICGERVNELRVNKCALFKGIIMAEEFHNLQFSVRHYSSTTYVRLLYFFLELNPSILTRGSVFTHGDDPNSGGKYVFTGIIDWEDSSFYPFYHECTVLTCTLSLIDKDDWYFYLPESISPLRFPVRWLVDRLWQIHLRTT
ncbi:hypothetical protein P170DRAFT_457654 [Aspergillus steynii IBT 23096]|uniref:Aminoglycoside phosphotransferase domain-containing protein n=1 Tax=Aspergillus steynii IBT 23096 TaxID=1392250 RepID=A0A2I2G376_9EURO|nr:uncharacterized protein P170DRAFT_457654 [Aspergillus steynii IBT 23096]PLB47329.1 hypothetical protein P170DRAFT_457654 [Aspergillus steynii IBT 23096]